MTPLFVILKPNPILIVYNAYLLAVGNFYQKSELQLLKIIKNDKTDT